MHKELSLDELADEMHLFRIQKDYARETRAVAQGVRHKAKEYGIYPSSAKKIRMHYLVEQLYWLRCWADGEIIGVYTPDGKWIVPQMTESEIISELLLLNKSDFIEPAGQITPEMIERARNYPVNSLLEFTRGKIRCINPEHTDNNPTMYHGTKINKAICPACHVTYDSIEITKIIEGLSFHAAVRKLCSQ